MSWTLITGGALRLGAEIARTLAEKQRDLVIHYKTSKREAEELVESLRKTGVKAELLQGDFSTFDLAEDFIARYLARFPVSGGVVCNVGDLLFGSPLQTRPEELSALFQTHLMATLMLLQALTPSLKAQKGQIVTIGMVGSGEVRANTHAFGYNLCKTGLWMLTKSLAKELAPDQVTVNMVSPGYMEESVDLPKDLRQIPMGRLARFEEVARVVSFLMDPASSYITGQNIQVAGGLVS